MAYWLQIKLQLLKSFKNSFKFYLALLVFTSFLQHNICSSFTFYILGIQYVHTHILVNPHEYAVWFLSHLQTACVTTVYCNFSSVALFIMLSHLCSSSNIITVLLLGPVVLYFGFRNSFFQHVCCSLAQVHPCCLVIALQSRMYHSYAPSINRAVYVPGYQHFLPVNK